MKNTNNLALRNTETLGYGRKCIVEKLRGESNLFPIRLKLVEVFPLLTLSCIFFPILLTPFSK